MESLPPKTVYNMYYTMIKVTKCQNQNFTLSRGMAIFDDPQNDLNDLEKIQPYDFLLDGPLKLQNQS